MEILQTAFVPAVPVMGCEFHGDALGGFLDKPYARITLFIQSGGREFRREGYLGRGDLSVIRHSHAISHSCAILQVVFGPQLFAEGGSL